MNISPGTNLCVDVYQFCCRVDNSICCLYDLIFCSCETFSEMFRSKVFLEFLFSFCPHSANLSYLRNSEWAFNQLCNCDWEICWKISTGSTPCTNKRGTKSTLNRNSNGWMGCRYRNCRKFHEGLPPTRRNSCDVSATRWWKCWRSIGALFWWTGEKPRAEFDWFLKYWDFLPLSNNLSFLTIARFPLRIILPLKWEWPKILLQIP